MVRKSVLLVAAVALVFALPHCAIDDRKLEEQEGSSNGGSAGATPLCTPEPDDSECIQCTKRACCAEYTGCITSVACQNYVSCGANCGDDAACVSGCANDYPEGAAVFNEIIVCNTARCPVCAG